MGAKKLDVPVKMKAKKENKGVHLKLPRDEFEQLKAELKSKGWTLHDFFLAAMRQWLDGR